MKDAASGRVLTLAWMNRDALAPDGGLKWLVRGAGDKGVGRQR